jgi:hypothetical protein
MSSMIKDSLLQFWLHWVESTGGIVVGFDIEVEIDVVCCE